VCHLLHHCREYVTSFFLFCVVGSVTLNNERGSDVVVVVMLSHTGIIKQKSSIFHCELAIVETASASASTPGRGLRAITVS